MGRIRQWVRLVTCTNVLCLRPFVGYEKNLVEIPLNTLNTLEAVKQIGCHQEF
jgi:hypothetical protein